MTASASRVPAIAWVNLFIGTSIEPRVTHTRECKAGSLSAGIAEHKSCGGYPPPRRFCIWRIGVRKRYVTGRTNGQNEMTKRLLTLTAISAFTFGDIASAQTTTALVGGTLVRSAKHLDSECIHRRS